MSSLNYLIDTPNFGASLIIHSYLHENVRQADTDHDEKLADALNQNPLCKNLRFMPSTGSGALSGPVRWTQCTMTSIALGLKLGLGFWSG